MINYDDFLEFYSAEREYAKNQVRLWQKRIDELEKAYTEMLEASRKSAKKEKNDKDDLRIL